MANESDDSNSIRIIRKRSGVGLIGEDEYERIIREFCPSCESQGIKALLGPRIYFDEKGKRRQPDSDWQNWKQCTLCGQVIETYKIKREAHIVSEIELPESPFDSIGRITPIGDYKGKYKRGENPRNEKKDLLDYVHDSDVKKELRKGATLISYSES